MIPKYTYTGCFRSDKEIHSYPILDSLLEPKRGIYWHQSCWALRKAEIKEREQVFWRRLFRRFFPP